MTYEEICTLIDEPRRRRDVSALELTTAFLERITQVQSHLNALYTITADLALKEAVRADSARSAGSPLPLDGLPIVIKDNIDVDGVLTTNGAAFLAHNIAHRDATCVAKLRSAGAVVLGKAALHELAYGVTCNNEFYGPTRNPWDLERIPGGSSGGCGSALGADLAIGAIGTDTGGSVRIPAALTGVTGLRPTYGAVSMFGVWPSSPTFDTVGPLARSVEDVARLNDCVAGYDPGDARSAIPQRVGQMAQDRDDLAGVRIGLPRSYFIDNVEPEVLGRFEEAAEVLSNLGAHLIPLEIPEAAKAVQTCTTIIKAEVLSLHDQHLAERPQDFGSDVRRRLALGERISGVDVMKALQAMYEWRRSLRSIFERIDLLMTPTTPSVAPAIANAEMIATTASLTRFTYPWSLGGLPAVALPCGLNSQGLPTSIQFASAPWGERMIVRVAALYQSLTAHHRLRPSIRVGAAPRSAREEPCPSV